LTFDFYFLLLKLESNRQSAMQTNFMRHPLAFLAASFACGIVASRFLSSSFYTWLLVTIFLFIIALFFFKQQKFISISIAAAFFSVGALCASVETQSKSKLNLRSFYSSGAIKSGDPVELTGVLVNEPETAIGLLYLNLKVENIRYKAETKGTMGLVRLVAPIKNIDSLSEYESLELRYGARIRVMVVVFTEESFRNPGVNRLTEFLEQRGYDASATIKSPLLIERLDDERVFLPLAWLYKFRSRLIADVLKKFSPETAGVLTASLFGNRYYLSYSTAERFREGGTFHVLVISGLHISFLGFVSLVLIRRITQRRWIQFAVSIAVVWAYSLMVGAETSVVRAAVMFTAISFAPVINRQSVSFNALGGAALVLLVYRPADLFDPSFQLTFLAVLAIVAFALPIIERLRSIGKWQPSDETPYPPNCLSWLRKLSETLYWSERNWQRELKRSTWSCNLFKTPLAEKLERFRIQKLLRSCFEALIVSFCVLAMMLPLMILYFHRLSIAAVVLNIFVEVLIAAMCLSALIALIVSNFSEMFSYIFISLAETFNYLATHSVTPFSRFRIASFRIPEYSGFASIIYGIYFLPLTVLLVELARWQPLSCDGATARPRDGATLATSSLSQAVTQSRSRTIAQSRRRIVATSLSLLIFLFALIVFHPFSAKSTDGRLQIDFLDVGQGDSALITTPDGTTILIDGGGRGQNKLPKISDDENDEEPFMRDTRGVGEAVVAEFLWHRGLSRVDYIVATHADTDHIDGLNDVARNFKIKNALVARAPSNDPEFFKFANTLKRENIPLKIISRGDVLKFGDVTIEILAPEKTNDANTKSSNEESVVLILRYGSRAFLFTGDIESKTENALLVSPESLRSDVVKVAHHGSKTSSTENFIGATQAKFAIISVGLLSPFGHPNKEVTERWKSNNAEVMTTGAKGTITFSTDGKDLKVETYVE
jgi:competence protein ComEC